MRIKQVSSWIAICALSSVMGAPRGITAAERADAPASGELELQEVIVEAQRKSENLQVVPITVTALTGEDIRQKNITDPQDLNLTVPALTVTQAYLARASSTYTIRGQGQTLGGGDPAVATYFDEVPTTSVGPGYFFDLASFEVLKGPQGTLFGRNSTGGAVLFVPQRPTKNFSGYADVQFGNYAARRYQTAVNFPIVSDVLYARFAADANYRDGYTTNVVTGRQYDDTDYQAARLGVLFTPNVWFENYFLVNFATLNEHGPGLQALELNPKGTVLSFFPQAQAVLDAQRTVYGPRKINAWVPPSGEYIQSRNYAVDNTTTITLTDDISLKNIFGFRRFLYRQSYESFGLPFPVFEIIGTPRPYWSAGYGLPTASNNTYSDEIQLRGNSLKKHLHWTAGLYYERTLPNSDHDHDLANVFGQLIQDTSGIKRGNSKAVFGQLTYDLTDQLKFTAGARYTEDSRRQVASQFFPAVFPCVPGQPFPPITAGLGYCNVDLSAKFHSPSWNVSLQYQLDPATMLYLTSRRGYKSGGFNNTAPNPATQSFQPEHVTDVELGAKTEFQFGDVKGRVNADVFRSKFTGSQERVIVTADTAVGKQLYAIVTNVGSGVIQGTEIEATIIPSRHLEISGFYSYLDPYFTSNSFGGVNYINVPVPNISKNKASATVRYLLGLPATAGEASVSATYAYQSAVHQMLVMAPSDSDPRKGILPGYGVLNLRADWTNVLGHPLDIGAFVDNATDKTYLILMQDNYDAFGVDVGQYGAPRMFGVSVRWHFGE